MRFTQAYGKLLAQKFRLDNVLSEPESDMTLDMVFNDMLVATISSKLE